MPDNCSKVFSVRVHKLTDPGIYSILSGLTGSPNDFLLQLLRRAERELGHDGMMTLAEALRPRRAFRPRCRTKTEIANRPRKQRTPRSLTSRLRAFAEAEEPE
jgi:hypothetical protein